MEEKRHKPCKHRKRETRDGVELDWRYAIGYEEVGDMPCEYCSDWRDDGKKERHESNSNPKRKSKGTNRRKDK